MKPVNTTCNTIGVSSRNIDFAAVDDPMHQLLSRSKPKKGDHLSSKAIRSAPPPNSVDAKSLGPEAGTSIGNNTSRNKKRTLPYTRWSQSDFDICGVVGKGHYGVVLKARRKTDRGRVALKRLSKEKILQDWQKGGKSLSLLKREIEIHSRCVFFNLHSTG